jgi:hypothetical protein
VFELLDSSRSVRLHEQELIEALFGEGTEVRLSDLKKVLYQASPRLENRLERGVVDAGLFNHHVRSRQYCTIAGLVMFIVGVDVSNETEHESPNIIPST